jgi:hypothetical protein
MRGLLVTLLLTAGCSSVLGDHDRNVFGDDLGRFSVTAKLAESTCGAQALGTPDEWSFQVQMSRESDAIYWNQGADAVAGDIAADGVSFLIESVTEVPVELGQGQPATCVMDRQDSARGELDDPGLDVRGFSGTLTYRFVEAPGTGCSDLVGVEGGFEELPCRIQFKMGAVRDLAPEDRTN